MTVLLILIVVLFVVREISFNRSLAQAASEREGLLQRIQAPEVAVASFASREDFVPANPVPALSDEEMWEVANGG